jgi:hypothetical protein
MNAWIYIGTFVALGLIIATLGIFSINPQEDDRHET